MNKLHIKVCGMVDWEDHEPPIFRAVKTNRETWLYPVNIDANAAAHVYCADPRNTSGFAGRELSFKLEDGTVARFKGPWLSGPSALFERTGIDLRNKHRTFVVIARSGCSPQHYSLVLNDIVYIDNAAEMELLSDFKFIGEDGDFQRGDALVKQMVQDLKCDLYYYIESAGGAHHGWEKYK